MKKRKDKPSKSENYSEDLNRYTLLIEILENMDQLPQDFYYNEVLDKINIDNIERYLRREKMKNINNGK